MAVSHNVGSKHGVAPLEVSVEAGNGGAAEWLDDDGRPRRTGTFWTASAHIVTAVIGSGVLSLAWAIAQLGWVAGPAAMLLFAFVTYYTATLLAECYRTGDPETGKRNYTYMDAVRSNLGGAKVAFCGVIQYANLVGVAIGYTIAASISMKAVRRAGCFHAHGHADPCNSSSTPYMILFGVVQILFSQIPDFDQIWWLSIVAAVMSFTYSSIGLSLGIAQTICKLLILQTLLYSWLLTHMLRVRAQSMQILFAANGGFMGSLTGISIGAGVTSTQKIWHTLQAFGDIAFAYSFSNILIEIQVSNNRDLVLYTALQQDFPPLFLTKAAVLTLVLVQDTIKAPPPSESKVMQKATRLSVATTTIFYMLCGCMGYAAFGDKAPDNLLTGFGFFEPFWLIDIANVAIVVHLVGAYQVFCQPIFAFVERRAAAAWPDSAFVSQELRVGPFAVSVFRLTWRSSFVCLTTVVAMLLPFFGNVVGFLGAVSFWPLTVYFPVEMYIKQRRVPRGSTKWICLQTLSVSCLLVSVAAAAGSIADVIDALKVYRPFSG
jgi:amino acid permease